MDIMEKMLNALIDAQDALKETPPKGRNNSILRETIADVIEKAGKVVYGKSPADPLRERAAKMQRALRLIEETAAEALAESEERK